MLTEDDILLEDGYDINMADIVYDLQQNPDEERGADGFFGKAIKFVLETAKLFCF